MRRVFSLLLLFFFSIVSSAPLPCKNENFEVNSHWTMPLTDIYAPNEPCNFKFNIKEGSFAIVDLLVKDSNGTSIVMSDSFGNNIDRKSKLDYTQSIAMPGTFNIYVATPFVDSLKIQMNVTVKDAKPQENVGGSLLTNTNSPSTILYFSEWKEGTSYNFNSLKSKIDAKVDVGSGDNFHHLENVFIYDDGVLVGTLFGVDQDHDFVSKSNKLTFFMAKNPEVDGVLFVTDNSNVEKFAMHYISYVYTSSMAHLVMGDDVREGALTVIGKSDGSTPITVTQLLTLNDGEGEFSYLSGGPLADHSKEKKMGDDDIPVAFSDTMITFYISKNMGVITYTNPQQ